MRKWVPLTAVCLGSFLFLLDTTVLSVALPRIGADLHAPLDSLQWVANVYTLVLAVLMLTMGSLADRWTARTVYLGGLGIFGVASFACALAPAIEALVAARAVQGVGGTALAVTSFALLGAVYRGPDLGRAMGVFGAVTGLAAAIGPLLGGVLTEYLGWRAIFLVNVPLTALALAVGRAALPRTAGGGARHGVDIGGVVTFGVSAGSLTYGLTAGNAGWLVLAAGALGMFVRVELRSAAPLVDVRLFTGLRFTAVMVYVVASTGAFGALVWVSVWVQSGLGYSPVRAGLALLPLAGAAFVTSLVTGRRLHGRSVVGVGLLLTGVGAGLSILWLDGGLAITGVGIGVLGPGLGAAVFAALPPERTGLAAGLMTTFRQLGQTLGVVLFGLLFRSGGLEPVLIAAAAVGFVGAGFYGGAHVRVHRVDEGQAGSP
ncbi:MFS transporter [Cryptosporangium sp. NPDC048952]|uniref:MFS transporter n=1 Tax=Cryptosporangium sp. NPDC048952 TaxID=3363961 RepID=UPI0037223442